MKRRVWTIAAAAALFAGVAWAQGQEQQRGTSDISQEANKQLALVDAYLGWAIDNAKVITTLAEMPEGKADDKILSEVRKNLESGLDRSRAHVKDVRMLTAGAKALPGAQEVPRLLELDQHLAQAQSAQKKLAMAKRGEIGSAIDPVAAHLASAEETFRDIAKTARYTRLEEVRLRGIPVKGTEPQPQGTPGY